MPMHPVPGTYLATVQLVPEPSYSSTLCSPGSTSRNRRALGSKAQLSVTEGRPSPSPPAGRALLVLPYSCCASTSAAGPCTETHDLRSNSLTRLAVWKRRARQGQGVGTLHWGSGALCSRATKASHVRPMRTADFPTRTSGKEANQLEKASCSAPDTSREGACSDMIARRVAYIHRCLRNTGFKSRSNC